MSIENKILEMVKNENPSNPMVFVQNIVKEYSLEKMNMAILNCNECKISNCNKTIGYGNPNASILLVGENALPDHQKPEYSDCPIPFGCGEERVFLAFLEELCVDTSSLYVINSVQCMPVDSCGALRVPTVNERLKCRTYLDYTIETVKPLLIIAVGGVSVNNLNEDIGKQGIMNLRGNMFTYRGIPVMPTCHPKVANMLGDGGESTQRIKTEYTNYVKSDLKVAIDFFKSTYPDINIFK